MRKFLIKTGLFTTGFIFLNLILYVFVFHDLLYEKYLVNKNELSKYKIFLLSDSHGVVLEQKSLDYAGIYNFSYGSDSYRDMYFKLNYLIENGIIPGKILLTADDHTLSNYRRHQNNRKRSVWYADYKTYSQFYPSGYFTYLLIKYPERFLPMVNPDNAGLFNKQVSKVFNTNLWNDDVKRITWLEKKNKKKLSSERKKAQFKDNDSSEEIAEALIAILDLCKENQIEVTGLKFPLSGTYIRVLEGASYHADSVFLKRSVPIRDYQAVFMDNDSLFLDPDHLNHPGSIRFAEILSRDLTYDKAGSWNQMNEPSSQKRGIPD